MLRAVHVYYRKIREHIWVTEWDRNGMERLGNGKLEQCGEGQKTKVFRELSGGGDIIREGLPGNPPWKLFCLRATHSTMTFYLWDWPAPLPWV